MPEAKQCEDCGLRRTTSYQRWLDLPEKFCFAHTGDKQARLSCNKLTIERLRARVVELEQLPSVHSAHDHVVYLRDKTKVVITRHPSPRSHICKLEVLPQMVIRAEELVPTVTVPDNKVP